jgi:uncharacterized membrane protein SirB2
VSYLVLKHLHQLAVTLSVAGFVLRGLASFAGAAWVRGRVARTLPHVIDTVLLASAIAMVALLRPEPGAATWIAAKVVGLVVYVALGMIALRPRFGLGTRVAAWVGALLVVTWIVSVALSKNPAGFLAA